MARLIRVRSVEPLEHYRVRVLFTTGEVREIDVTPYIREGPIFEPVRNNNAFFRSVGVEGGTIAWPNGADIDPDVLYYNGQPPWAHEQVQSIDVSTK
jgi:hypothetical protein